jgi:hypothetical protein
MSTFWRGAVLAAGILFILVGPLSVQVFGGPSGPLTRPWRMYTGVGRALCAVRFHRRIEQNDGTVREVPIDRAQTLGFTERPPPHVLLLTTPDEVRAQGARLCKRLGTRADVRVDARCSGTTGWEPAIGPEEPLCR